MKWIGYFLVVFSSIIFIGAIAASGPEKKSSADFPVTEVSASNLSHSQPISDAPRLSFFSIARGMVGMGFLILVAWLFSTNRRGISWKLVAIGLAAQMLLAAGVLMFRPIRFLFEVAGKLFVLVLDFSREGSRFLFGSLMDINQFGSIYVFQLLPAIVFFAALTSMLFYLGIMQKVVQAMAWLVTRVFRISGPEGLTAAGNVFLGMLEAPLLVKGYLNKMTRAEIMLVMVAGMGTIAGGVMAVYSGMLGGSDPEQRLLFAKHLLTASVMAAPGAVIFSRILYPQSEAVDSGIMVEKVEYGDHLLDSLGKGAWQGLKIAAGVAATLLVFLAMIALINHILLKIGHWTDLNQWISGITGGRFQNLSLQFLFGTLFSPIMWLIGICPQDMALVGQLAGEKLATNEFVGYISLASLKDAGAFVQDRSVIMATYLLSGFANFASVGMLIGGLGIMAPSRRKWISEFGMRALLGGTLVSMLSATLIGMMLG